MHLDVFTEEVIHFLPSNVGVRDVVGEHRFRNGVTWRWGSRIRGAEMQPAWPAVETVGSR